MKRRLLPILMTLVLVCALPIWAAFVTSGDVTNPLVSTAWADPIEGTFTQVTDETTLKAAVEKGESVILMQDIEISSRLEVKQSLTLDLNGYVLKMSGTGGVIRIKKYAEYAVVEVEIKDGMPGRVHTGGYAALPAGGVITGGNAYVDNNDQGGGIFLDGGSTLKLAGGCITGCHASYGGGIRSFGELYISGTAKIENCTSKWGSDDAILSTAGNIYADGGTVDGTVNNQGTIKHSNGVTAVTVFKKAVYNQTKKIIEDGIYKGTVENTGTITGGTFCGGVTIRKGYWGWESTGSISGGTFYGSIVNEAGPEQVTGGTFAVTFDRGDGTKTGPELVPWNDKVPRPTSDPEKSGHTFVGWYLGDALYDFDTPVNAPLTLTARWKEVPSSGGYYYYPTTDTKTDDTKGSPKTADPGVALYGVLSLLSLTGLTCTAKKR